MDGRPDEQAPLLFSGSFFVDCRPRGLVYYSCDQYLILPRVLAMTVTLSLIITAPSAGWCTFLLSLITPVLLLRFLSCASLTKRYAQAKEWIKSNNYWGVFYIFSLNKIDLACVINLNNSNVFLVCRQECVKTGNNNVHFRGGPFARYCASGFVAVSSVCSGFTVNLSFVKIVQAQAHGTCSLPWFGKRSRTLVAARKKWRLGGALVRAINL